MCLRCKPRCAARLPKRRSSDVPSSPSIQLSTKSIVAAEMNPLVHCVAWLASSSDKRSLRGHSNLQSCGSPSTSSAPNTAPGLRIFSRLDHLNELFRTAHRVIAQHRGKAYVVEGCRGGDATVRVSAEERRKGVDADYFRIFYHAGDVAVYFRAHLARHSMIEEVIVDSRQRRSHRLLVEISDANDFTEQQISYVVKSVGPHAIILIENDLPSPFGVGQKQGCPGHCLVINHCATQSEPGAANHHAAIIARKSTPAASFTYELRLICLRCPAAFRRKTSRADIIAARVWRCGCSRPSQRYPAPAEPGLPQAWRSRDRRRSSSGTSASPPPPRPH